MARSQSRPVGYSWRQRSDVHSFLSFIADTCPLSLAAIANLRLNSMVHIITTLLVRGQDARMDRFAPITSIPSGSSNCPLGRRPIHGAVITQISFNIEIATANSPRKNIQRECVHAGCSLQRSLFEILRDTPFQCSVRFFRGDITITKQAETGQTLPYATARMV
ncbi:hypothetical protein GYMLUDRAFT_882460 [Collybiopsis luxurians FD-317 M1]|uniref:Uncharacterized protein n=1 Tax=Collybiopsis luxurians FD-317 M1 TaxID=944289 RepID=A0A0D0BKA3_9AGAR|nr:hypothetical protein GYMLUDRAFT_882460 [Collybiopsis luxurians FD-317 M1]